MGPPQKTIFDRAATLPNALLTDTLNPYPANDTSGVYFGLRPSRFGFGILALQWKQKLDLEPNRDGGFVEFSVDTGRTWSNAFNSPYVYNLYGHDPANVDTLANGDTAYTGTDTAWKDIWLCYDLSWLSLSDSLLVRFTLKSDSSANLHEGWMIDNLLAHITFIHTVNEFQQDEYVKVFPNPTTGIVNIETKKTSGFHIIEEMVVVNVQGEVVQRFGKSPVKFSIDIGHHPPGQYLLKITSNQQSESLRVILQSE